MGKNSINILTLNVRGLNGGLKRNNIFKWLKDNQSHIVFLQETYCTPKLEPILSNDWGGISCHATTSSSHSRGVSILFNCKFPINIINVHRDQDGRKLLVNVEIYGNPYTFVNVYAPNTESNRR